MNARKITAWHDAGLIDTPTRDRLIAHEKAHTRPLALWAVVGIGALAIGLGLVSVIAANWEAIPGTLRLAVHLALICAGLSALGLREARLAAALPWAAETLAFVTAALGLTFFGHLGQVYQTSSPLWQPLAAWLVLFVPLLLLTGRGWLSALAVVGGSVWCAWEYANTTTGFGGGGTIRPGDLIWPTFVTALPVLHAPLAAWLRARSARAEMWRRTEQLALAYAVAGASLAAIVASLDGFDGGWASEQWVSLALCGALGVAAGLGVASARPGTSGRMAGAIIAGAGLTLPLAHAADGLLLPAAALFMALWTGIAAAALTAGWRGVFQLAVAVIAVRLIILSFELAGDLLASGFGLILAGIMIVGVAMAATAISRRFAPPPERAP
jgi:hypothetical protein